MEKLKERGRRVGLDGSGTIRGLKEGQEVYVIV